MTRAIHRAVELMLTEPLAQRQLQERAALLIARDVVRRSFEMRTRALPPQGEPVLTMAPVIEVYGAPDEETAPCVSCGRECCEPLCDDLAPRKLSERDVAALQSVLRDLGRLQSKLEAIRDKRKRASNGAGDQEPDAPEEAPLFGPPPGAACADGGLDG